MKKIYVNNNRIVVAEVQSDPLRQIIELAKDILPYNRRNPVDVESIFLYKERNKHYFLVKNQGKPYIGVLTRKGIVEVQHKVDFKETKNAILKNINKSLFLKIENEETLFSCANQIIKTI